MVSYRSLKIWEQIQILIGPKEGITLCHVVRVRASQDHATSERRCIDNIDSEIGDLKPFRLTILNHGDEEKHNQTNKPNDDRFHPFFFLKTVAGWLDTKKNKN